MLYRNMKKNHENAEMQNKIFLMTSHFGTLYTPDYYTVMALKTNAL